MKKIYSRLLLVILITAESCGIVDAAQVALDGDEDTTTIIYDNQQWVVPVGFLAWSLADQAAWWGNWYGGYWSGNYHRGGWRGRRGYHHRGRDGHRRRDRSAARSHHRSSGHHGGGHRRAGGGHHRGGGRHGGGGHHGRR